jgi:drug/metabolite transporter (DMT)-like permease
VSGSTELAPAAPGARAQFTRSGWIALLAVYVFWGSTYPAIRVGVQAFPPLLLTGLFYVAAAAVLFPFVWRSWITTDRSQRWRPLRHTATVGILMLLCGNGLLSVSEVTLPSGVAALVAGTFPLWLVALEALFITRVVPAGSTIVGLAVGLIGIAILAAPSSVQHVDLFAVCLVLIGAVFWASGSLYSKHFPHPANPFLESAEQMLAGGVGCVVAGVLTGEVGTGLHPTGATVAAIAWLAVPGGVVAFTSYIYALKALPTSIVSTYAFVNPIVAVALGVLLLRERLTAQTVIAMVVILLGIALILRDRIRAPA